jgi:hypothetical protein
MVLRLMKPYWLAWITFKIIACNLLANNLVKNLIQ